MAYFDFSGVRVDEAFRQFCRKLYLKAETQEIDRILDGFSARYFQCNPTTIFVSPSERYWEAPFASFLPSALT